VTELEVMAFDAQTPSTLFVAFADPPPDRDAEFNEWYDTIHGPDALANGSFTAMHRFRAVGDGHRAAPYLALWEGRFTSESEAWAYIGPRAQALREAGRAGDISSVRFALMLFRAANPRGSRCEPVRAITTVQNDWRDVAGAAGAQAWWDATGLDAIDAPTRWLVTSDAAGRGAGYHLAVFAHDHDAAEAAATSGAAGIAAAGMSPLPPYETIFGSTAGDDVDDRPTREPAPAWLMRWEPITSLRA
jgi:hypothetical protein